MKRWSAGIVGLGALVLVGCGTPAKEKTGGLAEPFAVTSSDVRIGLTADDGGGGEATLAGEGFERLSAQSYVRMVENGGAEGSLDDGGNAVAQGLAESSLSLQGLVLAKPGVGASTSEAQVVQLTNTVLTSNGRADGIRVEVDTEVEVAVSGAAVAICAVEGEATLEGHSMAKVRSTYYFYSQGEQIVVYLGPRGQGKSPVAVFANGGRHRLFDPSFYFKLGPGIYELHFTLKLSASCPPLDAGSAATLKAASDVALK